MSQRLPSTFSKSGQKSRGQRVHAFGGDVWRASGEIAEGFKMKSRIGVKMTHENMKYGAIAVAMGAKVYEGRDKTKLGLYLCVNTCYWPVPFVSTMSALILADGLRGELKAQLNKVSGVLKRDEAGIVLDVMKRWEETPHRETVNLPTYSQY